MKIALCLTGTLRAPNTCLPTLYEHIIKPWDTDVIVCVNKCYSDDTARVDKLRKLGANIIVEDIREQPNPATAFPESFYNKIITHSKKKIEQDKNIYTASYNYLGPLVGNAANLHIRLNWYKLSNIIEKYITNYDYFIVTRPDHLYLFPIFDKLFLTKKDTVYNYSDHSFSFGTHGGVNGDFVIVHNTLILDWLRKSIEYLSNDDLQNDLINELNKSSHWHSEAFTAIIAKLCNWNFNHIDINSFTSADSQDELSSTASIKYDNNTNYYYKYDTNYLPAINNLYRWNNGCRWQNTANGILLTNK